MGKRPKKQAPKQSSGVSGFTEKMKTKAKEKVFGKSNKKEGKGRRHKKSALWYSKEIQRLKLKKRYEKVKLGVMR